MKLYVNDGDSCTRVTGRDDPVALDVSAQELRILAEFFLAQAEDMEKGKWTPKCGRHLMHFWKEWKPDFGDIVIANMKIKFEGDTGNA